MRIYLAGWDNKRNELVDYYNDMKIYLAGQAPWADGGLYDRAIAEHKPYILDSFYYITEHTIKHLPLFGDFILDSGAFTFMSNNTKKVDWVEYADRYAEFVKKWNIKKYFELDIDSVIGYDKVLKLRERIERQVGWQSIPVWHESRGKDNFVEMCQGYDYVAIGSDTNSGQAAKYMPYFIRQAHERGVKVHGLGFTALTQLRRCHFDSVDSTAWTTGNRYGFVYKFRNGEMTKVDVPKGKRIGNPQGVALNNYTEWIKFQKWAENHL